MALMDILTSLDRLDHIWIEKQQAMPKAGRQLDVQARVFVWPDHDDRGAVAHALHDGDAGRVEAGNEPAKG